MKNTSLKIILIVLVTLGLTIFNLPGDIQEKYFPFLPESVTNTKINLGLDLQGGSQLDYRIDLRKVPEADQEQIVDGVKEVIERRVNGLGVAEPNIYISEVAEEKHIVVELSETTTLTQEDVNQYLGPDFDVATLDDDQQKLVSLEKAKATVGKTIQLEFKEQKENLDTSDNEAEVAQSRENAEAALARITENGEDFEIVAQEEEQAYPGKVRYETYDTVFSSSIETVISDALAELEIGEVYSSAVDTAGRFVLDQSGTTIQESGIALIKLTGTSEAVKNEKEVDVSRILISYEGADGAAAGITRSADEAKQLANELRQRLADSENPGDTFGEIAREYSDDADSKDDGGKLDQPVITDDGTYPFNFSEASLGLTTDGEISSVIETTEGFNIIRADDVRENVNEPQYSYEVITYSTQHDPWQDTGLTGEHFLRADFQLDQLSNPYVNIQFNSEGADLFEALTERNVGKPIAIFVGGELISAPNVNQKISGGSAQITGRFTVDEARALARDLNTGAIPAPIILTGEYTIGATLGQEALTKSVNAGLIGLGLVMLFMIFFYRIPGLIASLALGVYSAILIFLIKSQIHLGLAVIISLLIFGYTTNRIIQNKDGGGEKFVSFLLACAGFLFITFVLRTGVVLTLAGTAGLILSIGMAVDANILIFERFKEEIRSGKSFKAALENGFNRAWTSIRDSNFSTLITCAILFYFGSPIIKGFAFNLAAGVLISMFTAITVTRTLMQGFIGRKIAKSALAFGAKAEEKGAEKKEIQIIKRSRFWLTFSGTLVVAAIVSIFAFGMNLGIDFTGGTLMEYQFEEPVEQTVVENALTESVEAINSGNITAPLNPPEEVADSNTEDPTITAAETENIDLSNMQILPSGEQGFIVKTKYLTSEQHDLLINELQNKLPAFTEPRFTTIGPVIGATVLKDAIKAILTAIVMIVLYVAFAFRKVGRTISQWKFGACAIAALIHDVVIVTGLFSILSFVYGAEIDALFITAMLTVLGYSVNDTIVVFDRVRENILKSKGEDLEKTANTALNETLGRSINTSVSTLIALISILLLGSNSIFFFILALTAGMAVGTYSSIFLATPLLVSWKKAEADTKK